MRAPPPFDDLDDADIARLMAAASRPGVRFAEFFAERRAVRLLRREEGTLRSATASVEAGVGIRALSGSGTGYAFSSVPSIDALRVAAEAAGRAAVAGGGGGAPGFPIARPEERRLSSAPAREVDPSPAETADRIRYLESVEAASRRADPRAAEVAITLSEESRSIYVANSEGRIASDHRVLTTATATVYVRSGLTTRKGSYGAGGRDRLETLLAAGTLSPEVVGAEAARRAAVLLDATEAPAGEMPVVIGNGWGGVLLHEAIGHGFEADFVRRGTSIFTGRAGDLVASELCTVVDDATLPDLRGSFAVDDEGTSSRRNVLIERGRLRGYLHDLLSADALGAAPTGNGRRHSFRTPPIPRQSNTFLLPGRTPPLEILRSVRRGLYAKTLGGGMVNIVNGNFVFEVSEGYLIEDGRATAPVLGANLVGKGHEVLLRITQVGSDFAFDPGVGVCGKEGQSQPVGLGQPTVLISSMTVGGTRL